MKGQTNTQPTSNFIQSVVVTLIIFISIMSNAAANSNDHVLVQINSTNWYFQTNQTNLADGTYNYTAYAQDSAGNVNSTIKQYVTIDITPPSTVTLLTPTNNDHTNDATPTFDWTDATDASPILYNLLISNQSNFSTTIQDISSISGSTYTLTTPLTDGSYYWKVRANDTVNGIYGDWSANGNFTVVIDTTNPDWQLSDYPKADNSTKIVHSITWDAKVYDANLYRISMNVTNSTGHLMFTNYTDDWNASWYNFSHTNDTTGWAVGNYTVELSATDDHTYGSLRGLIANVDSDDSGITFSKSTISKKIYIGYYSGGTYHLISDLTPAQRTALNIKFGVRDTGNGEYKWNMSFKRPAQDYLFGIAVPKDNIVVRNASHGHFIWKDWYFDFDDMIDSGWTLHYLVTPNYYVIYTNTSQCGVVAGQTCEFDPVVGGLNTQTEYYNIEVVPEYIPPNATSITNVTGNFYVNHSWLVGVGNVTNSYNVSQNGTWTNGSTNTYLNKSVGVHGWSNITIWAYNSTEFGKLSIGNVSQNTRVPNNIPVLASIGNKTVNEADLLTFTLTSTDTDSDVMNYTKDSSKGTLNINTGVFTWTPEYWEQGTYDIKFNATDGYGGYDNETISIVVVDRSPPVSGGGYVWEPTPTPTVVTNVTNMSEVESWKHFFDGIFGNNPPSFSITNITNSSAIINIQNEGQFNQEYIITWRLSNDNQILRQSTLSKRVKTNETEQVPITYETLSDGKYMFNILAEYGNYYQSRASETFVIENGIVSVVEGDYVSDTRIKLSNTGVIILGIVGIGIVMLGMFTLGARRKFKGDE